MFRHYLITAIILSIKPLLWGTEPLSLPSLLLKARDNNPDIQAARQAWKAMRAEIAPAESWPDPTFSYVEEQVPSGADGVDPARMRQYRVEQAIPFPGKPTVEGRLKYHEAIMAEMRYRETTLDVFQETQSRYYQLYLTGESIDLLRRSADLMKTTLRTSQARLAAGQTTAADVFMAQTELRRMENMLWEQQQAKSLIAAELNTLLNDPPDAPLGLPEPPRVENLPVPVSDLQRLAAVNSPVLRSADHEVLHGRARLRKSRLQFAPDFGFMYERETMDAGPAGREIGVSVTVPLWFRRPWGEFRAAREHLEESRASAQTMRNQVRKMVHNEYIETETHRELLRNYLTGLLPSTRSTLEIARQQYAGGKGDFLRFLEAFRAWINANLEYQNHLYEYGNHRGMLERWAGVPLARAKEALSQKEWTPMEESHEK